jgi:membrane protease YdiL (CAAX protease family)
MMDSTAVNNGEGTTGLPVQPTPQRLLREAVSLAAILMAVLFLALLELQGILGGQGYVSTLALVSLCWWHSRRFQIAVPLRSETPRGRWVAPLFVLALIGFLCEVAAMPLGAASEGGLSLVQAVHLVLLVPLSEELYFRGLLLGHLRQGMATWRAVVFCSLLFGFLHQPSGGVFTAIVLSVVTCGLVILTGGLEYAIAVHAAWNAFTVIVSRGDATVRWLWVAGASAAVVTVLFGCRRLGSTPRKL